MSAEHESPPPAPVARQGAVVEAVGAGIDGRGDGRATVGQHALTVPDLWPGERARVVVEHVSRGRPRAVGRRLEVLSPHPGRRPAPCPRHPAAGGSCGGCPIMTLTEAAQRATKAAMLAGIGLEVDEVRAGPGGDLSYRWSSKRVVYGEVGSLRLGSWARGSHRGAWMEGCLVDHPHIVAAARELEAEANALRIAPYREEQRSGDLRYVWLRTDGERLLATLVTASSRSRAAELLPEALRVPDGVAWSVQAGTGNSLRGTTAVTVSGLDRLTVAFPDVGDLDVGPLGFLQPNPLRIAEAYRDLVRGPDGEALEGDLALDLFAGAGLVTRALRPGFRQVLPVESYPESAAALGVTPMAVEAFLVDRGRTLAPYLVVANPPRKGLGAAVTDGLNAVRAPRVHLMTCGPGAFREDLLRLTAEGPYRLRRLRAYDTLPQTPHLELVAHLELR